MSRAGARAGDLQLRPAQPVALLVRPQDRRPHDRRRRAGRGRGDRLRRAAARARARTSAGGSFEGRSRYTPGESAPGAIKPVITRSHSDGWCSITGGVVVRDPRAAGLRGRYLFGDFCKSRIQSAKLSAGTREVACTTRSLKVSSLSSFGEDARGRVYAVSLDGHGLPPRPAMSVEELEGLDITRVRAENPAPTRCPAPTRGSSAATRRGWSTPGRTSPTHIEKVAAAVEARGGAGGIAVTHDHQRPRRGAAGAARAARPPAGRRAPLRLRRAARRRRSLRPVRGPLGARPRARPPRVRVAAARASPATRCSARAACSSPRTSASTSRRCSACASSRCA